MSVECMNVTTSIVPGKGRRHTASHLFSSLASTPLYRLDPNEKSEVSKALSSSQDHRFSNLEKNNVEVTKYCSDISSMSLFKMILTK